ncbi:two-component system, NtrC family, C4-dicarboxylate transport sensor histidine kinase DctB [Pseudoalteromonas citrea]|uniref:histidine kinase n=2 Tax=Pseudoalteromonas citrea TaxID=43655 RepID=A0AAD4AEI1_9GAMM|nr:ATP-binding protein [Pseudoalteromonas citrea]KAF7764480.1 two-component system, NtrC family, C4-dicarboxylate transport sensor histidine kinase DctB [Pseudoalteromonas citrea]
MNNQNEPLALFSSEPTPHKSHSANDNDLEPWLILIVDDDESVHQLSTLVLRSYQFEQRALKLLHAYSKVEALTILQDCPDIALVLLDVIMETNEAGLECAQEIRQNLCNETVRIVLRTGQPGSIPEHELMLKYDINDYKTKTELTKERLYTVITASLRSYEHLVKLANMAEKLASFNEELEECVAIRTNELEQRNTALLVAQQKIDAQQQVLVQQEKLASVGQLAAGIAHEINNPLSAISSNNEFISEHFDKLNSAWSQLRLVTQEHQELTKLVSEIEWQFDLLWIETESQDLVNETKQGLTRIANIVKDLNVFTNSSQQVTSGNYIEEVLNTVLGELNIELSASFRMHIECDDAFNAAPDLLSQALSCIVKNALESQCSINHRVEISAKRKERCLEIAIIDRGCGIPADSIHQIFDPFYTSKPIGSATGLGLTIANSIVKSHNGNIHVESKVDFGSTFTVIFPFWEN